MFDWSNNLRVAKELLENDEEEYHRTAISRAYYSAFGNARKYLEDKSFPYDNNDGSIHRKVWTSYSYISNEIFINGDRLRKQRVDADYKPKLNNFKSKSKRAVDLADLVNQKVREL